MKKSRVSRIIYAAIYVWAAVSAVLYVLFRFVPSFAEFFNNTVGAASRRVFAFITDFFPFSVAELTVVLSPLFVILFFVWLVVRIKRHGAKGGLRPAAFLLALICFVCSAFVFNGSAGYFGERVSEKMGLDTSDPTKEELASACMYLVEQINEAAKDPVITQDGTGATVNPYSVGETAVKIEAAYASFHDRYGFPQSFSSVPKVLASSDLMTYTHLSGIYSDYTGEININVNYPDYIVASTIAHELAHQRGICPENEANFMAYAVTAEAPEAYLRYSGALDAFSTVSKYLYKIDPDAYRTVRGMLCRTASDDLSAYSKFFDKYRDNTAAKVTNSVNDSYLKSQGTTGTVSYDESTLLIVRYIVTKVGA